ncbi:glycosyltransferase [Methylophaga sp.]|uniref:glycosyltransferase n=1 Tax=Methylophaga sp. TaxID=2024840 RepID=UPI003A93829F
MSNSVKFVYVAVSDAADHYIEMAILSVHCARQFNPKAKIELVVDRKTLDSLTGYRKQVIDLVDKVHVADVEGQNNAFTSRIIKTQLRKYITGDYLYIDIDAVPVADLSYVFNTDADLAMAYDHNVPPNKFIFFDYEREIFDRMQWPLPERYFNSGVMFVKDNVKTNSFFQTWHSLWKQNSSKGLHKDQPPMHEAIRRENIKVNSLGPEWNMLIGLQKGNGAKHPRVYHYSTIRFEDRDDTYFHRVIKKMKSDEMIDWPLINHIINTRFPWTNHDSIRLNFATGNYGKALALIYKKILKKLGKN